MKLLFLKTSTSGLDPVRDEPIELALASWVDGRVVGTYYQKFAPLGPVAPEAARVNHYSPTRWATAPRLTAAEVEKFAPMFDGADALAGFAVPFHSRFLAESFARLRTGPLLPGRIVDVATLAFPFLLAGKLQEPPSLWSLSRVMKFGEPGTNAAEDLAKTVAIFERLIGTYGAAFGYSIGRKETP